VFASRELTQSFATVKVGHYQGVRVYADNQQVGTTNRAGMAVIPRLRPFEQNEVRIETADLPIDAQIDSAGRTVRPYDRSGVTIDFGAHPSRSALVKLALANALPVPAGTTVQLEESDGTFLVAPGGETYLTGLVGERRGMASWRGGSCSFNLIRIPNAGPVRASDQSSAGRTTNDTSRCLCLDRRRRRQPRCRPGDSRYL